ncbi:D-alanine--D-alanine ligase family protein [Jiella sonneratiae]|uniref:D-alanine--D-alanine ligase n=1 Tax=Jiella sonneratiae TaxID=2816856 RepID=A0ABS3J7H8_9HYPH|nr:D-alanine--D-alanine ligase family protein [Jiella sonneratiae]MBO0905612.1 D-alanine--D-alanine ligase [Jiella sonneratiae]
MSTDHDRLRIAVLFGGRSAEHEVSVRSAANVMAALDASRYDPVPVFVTKSGRWLLSRWQAKRLETPDTGTELCLVPGGRGQALSISEGGTAGPLPAIDVVFPVLHGLPGEDGAVQGLCEVAMVPLAGCGILGSATALDKDVAKRLLAAAGIPVARAVTIRAEARPAFAAVEAAIGLPIFVKPARQGSSVGVAKVRTKAEFDAALDEAFRHDRVALAEEFVAGREIELAVLEAPDGSLFVSRPGEIVPAKSHGFYSYDAKYVDADGAALIVPAELDGAIEEALQDLAERAFRALGCDGMARVDFFVTSDGRMLVNELNTIPGFTDISMYSKVMAASGVSYPEVIDRLVAHGLKRAGVESPLFAGI